MSKNNKVKIGLDTANLLSDNYFQSHLKIQTEYAIAQTGGSHLKFQSLAHQKRVVNDVNILDSKETKQIIFSYLTINN